MSSMSIGAKSPSQCPGATGMKQEMQESYEKGVANHSAPSFALGTAKRKQGWIASPPVCLLVQNIDRSKTAAMQPARAGDSSLDILFLLGRGFYRGCRTESYAELCGMLSACCRYCPPLL